MNRLSFLIFVFASITPSLYPILDGRITPIYLDNRYTFTNGEWARGAIFFNQGFDLTAGTTAYLSFDTGAITASISLNGGTIIVDKTMSLRGRAYFIAPGYIRTKDTSAVLVYHESILQRLFQGTGKIKLHGPLVFQALSTSSGFDQYCTLDLSELSSNLNIVGGTVWWRNVITSTTKPPSIFFYSVEMSAGNTTINTPRLYFSGTSSLATNGQPLTINTLSIIGSGKLIVYSKSFIKLQKAQIQTGNRMELQNTTLDFISSSTGQINICQPYSSQGAISVNGNCIIQSSTNNKLWLDSGIDLEFLAGSRLTLNPGTSLSILPLS